MCIRATRARLSQFDRKSGKGWPVRVNRRIMSDTTYQAKPI